MGTFAAAGLAATGCDDAAGPEAGPLVAPSQSAVVSAVARVAASGPPTSTTATPSVPARDPATVTKLQKLARAFVDDLRAGRHAAARSHFAKVMLDAMSEAKVAELWPSIIKKAGAFQRVERTSHRVKAAFDLVRVTCKFEGATLDVKVVFDGDGKISGLWVVPPEITQAYEPPAYVDQAAFADEEVEVGQDPWKLPASLSAPKGSARVPAVVLVHGSGPQDRDESIGPNKPFRDLAWGLASQGIAVLRYEKRTKQHGARMTKEMLAKLTLAEESVQDAVVAVGLLRRRPDIDPRRVFVLGHSLGGTAIPRIARADETIRGFIVAAGSTRRFEELVLSQTRHILGADGKLDAQDRAKLAALEKQVQRARELRPGQVVPATELPLGVTAHYLLDLNQPPAELLGGETRPLLFLQGERDYQVTMEDFRGWQGPLRGKDNATFKSYAELNHLFMAGRGKSTPAEYEQPGHVAAQVISDIAEWIVAQR